MTSNNEHECIRGELHNVVYSGNTTNLKGANMSKNGSRGELHNVVEGTQLILGGGGGGGRGATMSMNGSWGELHTK